VGGVSSSLKREARKPHANSPAQTCNTQCYAIRILETLFYQVALSLMPNGRLKMTKRVVLVTGTPCVGKTSVARSLASKLDALYVNLTELALQENLISGKDEERGSMIVDENRMRRKIEDLVEGSKKEDAIIDGHYAVNVVPKRLVAYDFVLRRNPVELRKLMERCEFSGRKLWENLASEILDVCLVDALRVLDQEKVCELDITGKSVEETVDKILSVLSGHEKCCVGTVDWLGKLESEGLLDDYLKI
jgi:adenylate kinase